MIYCIAGKNQIAIDGVTLLLDQGISKEKIVACINKNDTGVNLWQPSFRFFCERNNIQILEIDALYKVEKLIFISLEYDRIIKTELFISKNLFNIHFSKLPAYKGMFTSVMPILNNEKYSGVTLHKIDRGIDTGDIIDQIEFPIGKENTGLDLYFKYLINGKTLLKRNIENLVKSNFEVYAQPNDDSSYFSKKAINFSELEVDFRKTATQIYNYIRAFTFRPYQLIKIGEIDISHCRLTNIKSAYKPGTKIQENEYCQEFCTIDYNIQLFSDQLSNLIEASKLDDLEYLIKLNELGYNLNEKNEKGWICLSVASYNESKRIFDYLLEKGSDVNTLNNNGTSVLMYAMTKACQTSNLYFVEKLLEKGAKIRHKDFNGISLLEYCKRLNNSKVYNYLKTYE